MRNKTQKALEVKGTNNPTTKGLVRWQKGCPSPNPKGRPHGVFSAAAREILALEDPRLRKTGAQRLVEQAFRRALQGSYRHLELILGYAEGKPSQAVEVQGAVAGAIICKIIHIGAKDESRQVEQ